MGSPLEDPIAVELQAHQLQDDIDRQDEEREFIQTTFRDAATLLNDDGTARTIKYGPNGERIPEQEALVRRLYDTSVREDIADDHEGQLRRARMLNDIIRQMVTIFDNIYVNSGSGKKNLPLFRGGSSNAFDRFW
jgi:hypothetical protein